MPSFYQRGMGPGQLPITPPDSGSGFRYSTMHYAQDPYASHQNMNQSRHDASYDYQQSYMQPAVAQAPPPYSYSQSSYQPTNNLPPIQNYYEPIGAPILPPLRIQDPVSFTDDYQRRLQQEQQNTASREQQRHAAKEDKPTGGVSAKLDYDMEHMTDFVTEATQSIFHQNMQGPSSFRKWVHQVLSATRLPSATILLSLHFLNDRVANFPESVPTGENQIYRLLAVSLILGSKFLDDNTFINRSWSDVTAIKVTELNQLEMKWLKLIKYELHIDPQAPNGLQAWLDSWKEYDAKYIAKQQQQQQAQQQQQHQATRPSPLNTNVYRSSANSDRYSPYPSPYSGTTRSSYGTPSTARTSQYGPSPYLSADPWGQASHAFDDFYKRQRRYPTLTEIDDVNRRVSEERARQSAYAYQQTAYPSYYQSPSYGSAWDQHGWSGAHRYDCVCSSCAYHYRPYPMTSSYAAQTVMG